MKRETPLLALVISLAASAASLAAQSADEVIQVALERHEQRVAGVDDYTLIQEMNGMPMPPLYYEKKERDGQTIFVSPSAAELALSRSGMSMKQFRDLLLGSLTHAGLQGVVGALEGATGEDLAGLVGTFGNELLSGPLGGTLSGPVSGGAMAAGARPSGAPQGVTGELTNAVLRGVEEGEFKRALVSAAKRVGLSAAATALEAATGVQIGALVNALLEAENFGDAIGNLAKALPSMAGGMLSRAVGLPGMPGAPGGGPSGMPGGAPGMVGPAGNPQAMMAAGMMTGMASAGMRMLSSAAFQGLVGLLSGGGQERVDEFVVLRQLQGRARIAGSDVVDGHECWVLAVDDLAELDLGTGSEFSPRSLSLYLDKAELVPRGGSMSGEMKIQGERRPVTAWLSMQDFREVEGMLHPFRTSVSFEGIGELFSEKKRKEMRKQLETARKEMERAQGQMKEMEKNLARLPPEQRRMVEQQLSNMPAMQQQALRQLEAMVEGFREMTIVVKELRVNEGPPEEPSEPGRLPGMPMMIPGMSSP